MVATRFKGPVLYFAYGGNMNGAQMSMRCPGAKAVATAKLPGHRIAFFGHSERWDGAEETVIAAPGETLYGVVYEVSFSALDRLDAWQGVRLDGAGPYFHSPTEVTGEDGRVYPVLLYRKDILKDPLPPSAEYLAHILTGAAEHGLPAAYIEKLAATSTRPAGYAVPKPDDADRLLISMTACVC